MQKNPRRRTLLFTLLAAVLISGCATSASDIGFVCEGDYPGRSAASGSYKYQSSPENFTYTVTAGIEATRLHLVFEQKEGSVAWRFSDPTGALRWEDAYGQVGRFDESRDFDPLPGDWTLEIDGSEGSGSYSHCWMAK